MHVWSLPLLTSNNSEPPNGVRAFKYKIVNTYNNSAQNCLSLCSEYGYPVGGMEYGDECCKFLPLNAKYDLVVDTEN